MAKQTAGLHSFHRKKRKTKISNKWKNFLDKIIYGVGVFGPILTIPQIMKVWVDKNAVGVSPITWGGYAIAAVFWLLYGIAHKEKPLIFMYTLWLILDVVIVVGTVIYG